MKPFWKIEAKGEQAEPAHIYIYDVIGQDWWTGEGVTAKQFIKDIAPLAGRALTLHLNCAGGDMFEGFAILAALDAHKGQKTVVVESLAASMASVLAMAADKGRIQMAQNAYLMIHNPRGAVRGTAADLKRMVGLMESLRGKMIATYRRHCSLTEEQIGAALDAETWYDAEQAKAAGLAHEIVGELKVAAALDGAALEGTKVPERIRALFAPPPADAAAAAVAEARAAVEASGRTVTELTAKLAKAEADGAAATAAAKAAGEQAVAELRTQLTAAQAQGVTLQAKLASLTGGLAAPGAGGKTSPAKTFAGAVKAIAAEHPTWSQGDCYVEAKRLHPDLWAQAKEGKA